MRLRDAAAVVTGAPAEERAERTCIGFFRYTRRASWPPLSWVARCPAAGRRVDVFHGELVETRPNWFCEAVWAGPYEEGGFDRTDIVFGSGGRRRGDVLDFVPSAMTIDRLHSIEAQGCVWVSNSLACLLAAVDGELDPAYPNYVRDIRTIDDGLSQYKRTMPTSAGPLRLTYYHNLRWDGRRLDEVEKPFPVRDFGSYAKYRGFLDAALQALWRNLSSKERQHRLGALGTISSGYDSSTVTALARKHGLEEAITITETERGESDSGEQFAKILGVRLIRVERGAWRRSLLPEVPFLVGDASGADVNFKGAEPLLRGRVLLTGYCGDTVWRRVGFRPPTPDLGRLQSGLSLTEYRLWAGFIHCAVPFIGARQIADIRALSNSPEMSAWWVDGEDPQDTTRHIDRPICRRILEDSGVPSDCFAARKRHTAVLFAPLGNFWSSEFRADYLHWLRGHSARWLKRGRIPPILVSAMLHPLQRFTGPLIERIVRLGPRRRFQRPRILKALHVFATREYLYRYLLPWAVARARARYSVSS